MNRIRDVIRQRDRRPLQGELPEDLLDEATSPLEQLIGAQNVSFYEAALGRLRSSDREAIVGRIEMQYSYEELATVLNKPTANAARVAVARALKRLVEEMRAMPVEDEDAMSVEGLIDRAVENIADGQPVNWALLDSQANDDDERKQLKMLRILEEIAQLHRSTQDSDADETFGRRARPSDSSVGSIDDLADSLDRAAATPPCAAPGIARTLPTSPTQRAQAAWTSGDASICSRRSAKAASAASIAPGIRSSNVRSPSRSSIVNSPTIACATKLLREGRALAKMRQPNVVSVLDVEAHEDRVGLCMEFVQGQTLEDVLQLQGTFSARETVLVGEDVCRALAAVHNAGFVHRDVKARNVMREQAGRIVLMDFGTGREARALEDARRPDVAGTPLYMAPEVLAGEPASMRSDVYSVGVLLYHLVTSEYPIVAQLDRRAARRAQGASPPLSQRSAGRICRCRSCAWSNARSPSIRRIAIRTPARCSARSAPRSAICTIHAGKPRVRCCRPPRRSRLRWCCRCCWDF